MTTQAGPAVRWRAQARMSRLFRIASYVLVNAVVVSGLLEGALRVRPELIPLEVLVGFQPTIRNEIAARRGLPRLASTQPVARDDGGPWLAVFGPSAVVGFPGSLSPRIRTAVRMLRSGELGRLLSISATVWQDWGPNTLGTWRQACSAPMPLRRSRRTASSRRSTGMARTTWASMSRSPAG